MKLSDEEVKKLVADDTVANMEFSDFYLNTRQAIRQLMEERDRYRELLNTALYIAQEPEVFPSMEERESAIIKWQRETKQALEKTND
jgi:hypothetical protein